MTSQLVLRADRRMDGFFDRLTDSPFYRTLLYIRVAALLLPKKPKKERRTKGEEQGKGTADHLIIDFLTSLLLSLPIKDASKHFFMRVCPSVGHAFSFNR